jgi:hypothetical protein
MHSLCETSLHFARFFAVDYDSASEHLIANTYLSMHVCESEFTQNSSRLLT